MAEDEPTPYREIEGFDNPSVPGGWSDPVPGEGMAGWRASSRAPSQEPRPLPLPLPDLLQHPETRASRLNRTRVNVGDASRRIAFAKADERSKSGRPEWDRRLQAWVIGSASDPSSQRVVRIRRGSYPGYPWWSRLTCSCPNESTGRQVCWHKAAVVRLWQDTGVRQHPGEPKEAVFGTTGADTA